MVDSEQRFRAAYDEHLRAVAAFALRRAATAADAEDIVAETFLVAWRRFGEAPADLRPWLFGVARHVLRHHYRATQRRDALSARLASALARLGHEPGADAGWLAEALPQLSESDRDILTLTAWEGFQTPRHHRCSGELTALLGDLESAGAVDRIIGSAAEPCGRGAGAA
ncbi:MAG: hypothetical protein QOE87_838, partial [Gaiellales bacterium]|nr:hypothetical protein [Gaiellales bacterium]